MNPRKKPEPGVCLIDIPGLREALAEAQQKQFRTRENSLLNLSYNLAGSMVRTMTVRDYVLLDRINSPFIRWQEPTLEDVSFFLWILSPRFPWWNDRRLLSVLRPLAAFFHGRKVRLKYGRNMPETSEPMVIAAFDYIDVMFYDSPPTLTNGQESCLSYLTGWFDAMQSEYYFSNDDIWNMGLPELFQRLSAIRQRYNPSAPTFSKDTDNVKLFVLRGLRSKDFTMDDLRDGKVKLPDNFSRN